MTVGFHEVVLLPTVRMAENAVLLVASVTALAASSCPGMRVTTPVEAVATPDQ